MADDIETFNKFRVRVRGDNVVILRFHQEMSKREAVNLAAWIVALVGEDEDFKRVLQAARNT